MGGGEFLREFNIEDNILNEGAKEIASKIKNLLVRLGKWIIKKIKILFNKIVEAYRKIKEKLSNNKVKVKEIETISGRYSFLQEFKDGMLPITFSADIFNKDNFGFFKDTNDDNLENKFIVYNKKKNNNDAFNNMIYKFNLNTDDFKFSVLLNKIKEKYEESKNKKIPNPFKGKSPDLIYKDLTSEKKNYEDSCKNLNKSAKIILDINKNTMSSFESEDDIDKDSEGLGFTNKEAVEYYQKIIKITIKVIEYDLKITDFSVNIYNDIMNELGFQSTTNTYDKEDEKKKDDGISENFKYSVKEGNIKKVREFIIELYTSYKKSPAIERYIHYAEQKLDNLYEAHDESKGKFERNLKIWNRKYINHIKQSLEINFSKERLEHLKAVIEEVYYKEIEEENNNREQGSFNSLKNKNKENMGNRAVENMKNKMKKDNDKK